MGIITIGPESAKATPGPICYGLGGKHPTVTDANVILGYISPDGFNSGKIKLDVERARLEMATQIAEPLNLSLERAYGASTLLQQKIWRMRCELYQ